MFRRPFIFWCQRAMISLSCNQYHNRYNSRDYTDDAGASIEEGVEGTTLDTCTLVGLYVNHIILLHIIGRILENIGIRQVDGILLELSVLFTIERNLLAQTGIGNISTTGKHIQNGVALTGKANSLR